MVNINAPIRYKWNLGWGEGIGQDRPVVNLLLKAIIEKNVVEMDKLYKQGASLKACDKTTLRRVLFHVVDNYPVMEWLVKHGVSRIGRDVDINGNNGINDEISISPAGYQWALAGRAYYLKAYNVMNLLCAYGFSEFGCYEEGWEDTWYADRQIFRTGDEKAIKILLENGYIFDDWRDYEKYVLPRSQVKRKTIGLDPLKFSRGIPTPSYETVPLLFGKKDVERRNKRRQEDYEDRVRAYKEFINAFGTGYKQIVMKREENDRIMGEIYSDMLKNGEI